MKARLLSQTISQEPPPFSQCIVSDGKNRHWAVLVGMKDGKPAIMQTFLVVTKRRRISKIMPPQQSQEIA